ncbi:hypothetical protein DSO57_1032166 [Entomophthora muscae]|uniref:Uncharacterized protein n=1 Tax=Entomophthora muscae TaxID=34485 RepID=A0ACC2SPE2_9FUNG|nr:hypothetical protein DSO57_1032166 [Entomophthora muscae]
MGPARKTLAQVTPRNGRLAARDWIPDNPSNPNKYGPLIDLKTKDDILSILTLEDTREPVALG